VRMIRQIVLIGSHNTALYSTFWKSRTLHVLSAFFGEGPTTTCTTRPAGPIAH